MVLQESEDKYSVFETSPVSIWVEDFTNVISTLKEIESQVVTDLPSYLEEHPDFLDQVAQMIKVRDINQATVKLFGAGSKEELLGSLDKVIPPEGMKTLKREILAIYEGKTYFEEETYNYTLDGKRLDILLTMTIPQETEKFDRILVSMMDITDRKKAEKSLIESEKNYRSIFENTGTSTIIVEEDTTISLANKEFEKLSEYPKQEIEGQKSWTDFVAFESELNKMKKYHYQRRINPDNVPKRYEFHFKDKQGQIKYISLTIDVIPDTSKSVASLLDITELKQTQEALHEREEKYRLLAENNAEIIWSVDPDLRFTYLSPSVERVLGYSQEEAYRVSLDKRVTPSTYAMLMEKYRELKEGKIKDTLTMELEQIRKDGSIICTEVSITPLFDQKGKLIQLQGVTREITKRKEMEKRLQILKYAVESSINGFALIDLHGNITYINPSFLRIGKFDHESEVLGKHFSEFLEKEEQSSSILNALYKQGEWSGELMVKRKDHHLIYIQLLASVVKDRDDNPVCFMGSFVDITARKKAEEKLQQAYEHLEYRVEARTKELKKSESRLKRSQQVAKVATWEEDFQTGERFWSDEQYRLFGYEPNELSEKKIIEKHIYPKEQKRIKEHLDKALQENQEFNIRFSYTKKNGEERICHCLGQVERDDLGRPLHIYGTMQDITEKIEMEEALQESKESYEQLLLSTQQLSSYKNIIGKSEQMRRIYTLIQQLANVDTTVLITGESGTGKELIVEALHYSGIRSKGPLIKVNCSALSEHLLESELFGHVRGAFTGATYSKKGRIEAAEGGTLFLDEIGDISPNLQLKLLRFLQEKNFERVGDVNTLSADVRIIAATNADLSQKVQEGSFRSDLYYRLKVIPINIPPLRKRPEDVPLLVNHFCQRFGQIFNKDITGVTDEVIRFFIKHPWPGNVRELEHVLECACIFCPGGKVGLEHLPEKGIKRDAEIMSYPIKKKKMGKEELIGALKQAKGNKTRAAELLGISRRTLYRWLSQYELV